MKSSSTDDDCGINEQCAGDLVIVENEGEGARWQDSSVSDSEHIEGTIAKHGAITSEQDDKTLSEYDNAVETEQAKVCKNLHKSFYILLFFTCRSEIKTPFTRNMKAMIKSGDWLSDEHMYLAQAIYNSLPLMAGNQLF